MTQKKFYVNFILIPTFGFWQFSLLGNTKSAKKRPTFWCFSTLSHIVFSYKVIYLNLCIPYLWRYFAPTFNNFRQKDDVYCNFQVVDLDYRSLGNTVSAKNWDFLEFKHNSRSCNVIYVNLCIIHSFVVILHQFLTTFDKKPRFYTNLKFMHIFECWLGVRNFHHLVTQKVPKKHTFSVFLDFYQASLLI